MILYIHGAGWVFGNAHTHDRLVRELAVGAGAAVVFPEYDLSPEARYPTRWSRTTRSPGGSLLLARITGWTRRQLAIAGDSVGGNMAAAVTLLAKERGDVRFNQQVLFYPVTDASFDTPSYQEFAEGYFLQRDGMKWFWDQYTTDEAERNQITASPLRATPRAARRPAAGTRHHRRGRRTARRGRGVRRASSAKPVSPSPRSASAASSTTS